MNEESDPNIDPVEEELISHRTHLESWTCDLDTKFIPDSQKSVVERFKRDCMVLHTDVSTTEQVSTPDLNDFTDRHNSLEIQYHNILKSIS
jgi:hypothetical protein